MDLRDLKKQKRLLDAAEGYLMLGLTEQALASLDQIPNDAGDQAVVAAADALRAEIYRGLGKFAEALEACERAIAVRPRDTSLLLLMGWCYKRTDQLRRAITALETAARIDPRQAIIPYNLACYLSLDGQRDSALQNLARALRIDTSYLNQIPDEPDFDPVRDDPEFQDLISSFQRKQS